VRSVERVLLRDGFAAFTMEAVAREAGLSLATVYRCFGDREGLLRAFVQQRSPRPALLGLLDRPVARAAELEPLLVTFTEQVLEALEGSRALFQLAFAAPDELRELLGRVRDAPRGVVAALTRFLSVQMEAGHLRRLDAHVLAAAFAGQLVALAIVLPGAGEALPPRPTLAATLVQAFLGGALP
jgi:AcrR family transcriptional regulator